jgi:hypothetical protein
MASLIDAKRAAECIVGPVCGNKARHFDEGDIAKVLHAYLIGRHSGVRKEYPIKPGAKQRIDFRFGDRPHGTNPCVLELAVRNSYGGSQLLAGQNKTELRKLSMFPKTIAQTRVLLLIDLGHIYLEQSTLQKGYDAFHLGPGRFKRSPVAILYVHRDNSYHFTWRPFSN